MLPVELRPRVSLASASRRPRTEPGRPPGSRLRARGRPGLLVGFHPVGAQPRDLTPPFRSLDSQMLQFLPLDSTGASLGRRPLRPGRTARDPQSCALPGHRAHPAPTQPSSVRRIRRTEAKCLRMSTWSFTRSAMGSASTTRSGSGRCVTLPGLWWGGAGTWLRFRRPRPRECGYQSSVAYVEPRPASRPGALEAPTLARPPALTPCPLGPPRSAEGGPRGPQAGRVREEGAGYQGQDVRQEEARGEDPDEEDHRDA